MATNLVEDMSEESAEKNVLYGKTSFLQNSLVLRKYQLMVSSHTPLRDCLLVNFLADITCHVTDFFDVLG